MEDAPVPTGVGFGFVWQPIRLSKWDISIGQLKCSIFIKISFAFPFVPITCPLVHGHAGLHLHVPYQSILASQHFISRSSSPFVLILPSSTPAIVMNFHLHHVSKANPFLNGTVVGSSEQLNYEWPPSLSQAVLALLPKKAAVGR